MGSPPSRRDRTPGFGRKLKHSDNGKSWEGFKGSNRVQPLEKLGGADGSRTHDLLNAIISNLSRASYSWKKYPAFLTSEGQQFFWF
jgi:hypothetical protein